MNFLKRIRERRMQEQNIQLDWELGHLQQLTTSRVKELAGKGYPKAGFELERRRQASIRERAIMKAQKHTIGYAEAQKKKRKKNQEESGWVKVAKRIQAAGPIITMKAPKKGELL